MSLEETASPLTPQQKEMLYKIPGNKTCCDCGRKNPEWASLSLATLICLECSGTHRGLGTHISFVRSVKMDSWTPSQLKRMQMGGNIACFEFLTSYNVDVHGTTIRERYDSQAADLYQQVLKAKVDGTVPIPTELPPKREAVKKKVSSMTGFGSSAHPREVRKENRKKFAIVSSAIVSVAAVAWGLSRRGGAGGAGKASAASGGTAQS